MLKSGGESCAPLGVRASRRSIASHRSVRGATRPPTGPISRLSQSRPQRLTPNLPLVENRCQMVAEWLPAVRQLTKRIVGTNSEYYYIPFHGWYLILPTYY